MRIIVSAGGTGGHIYPALAIINKFMEKEPDTEVLYIGTHNRMEKDIVPKRGIKYEELEIYGFSKTNIKLDIKNVFLIKKAYKKCLKIMKEFKPDVVLGIGGYVTYPVIKAANKLGIKTFIHEQNSHPGKSNIMLQRKADLIGVSFKESASIFKHPKGKVFYSGNPCGENALSLEPMDKKTLGLDPKKKLVVIVAGSLGSSTMNKKMLDFLELAKDEEYEVVYITGKNLYDDFIKDQKFGKNIKVLPYLDNLPALLKNTDLIVTRAGASTMSEILSLNLPAIFIPSPYVANNHQYYNALEIKNNGGGDIIEEKDLTSTTLASKINLVLGDEKLYNSMKENLAKMSMNNSSDVIYNEIKELIK
ncbi:MAG: undecaprenyldiphospho-muramoylpentapeptide beta-N-acetylglucosaminyltransferase [Bacilli bacterium]|nr:undecaprenyldiphospho-muramoylpentapeptide beta-N-acetylglucosaminyltransferase [Bacilli bacterium]